MSFDIDLPLHVVHIFAVFARVAAFYFVIPIFYSKNVSMRYRITIALGTTIVLLPMLPETWSAASIGTQLDWGFLVGVVGCQMFLGLLAGLCVRLLIESVALAGQIMGRDLGYAMANTIDPSQEEESTVISDMLMMIFTLMLLVGNVHHDLVRLAAYSFKVVGPDSFVGFGIIEESIVTLGARMFELSFQIALPIFAVILFSNVALALMSRFGQEFEVMMLSIPIRILGGLMVLIFSIPVIVTICRQLNQDILEWLFYLLGPT